MVHLNEIHEKFGPQGVSVLAISVQDAATIERFIEEFGVTYPTASVSMASLQPFRSGGVPHAHLIGSNGRILWEGNPGGLSDAKIEDALADTRILPDWPVALKAARKLFFKDRYANALEKVEKEIERGRLEAEDAEAATGIRDWLVWFGESSVEGVAKDIEDGRFYEASLTLEQIADYYKRHDIGKQAESKLDELLSDPARKLEVKAGAKLAGILAELAGEKPKKALKLLKPLLSRKYAETVAGQRAREMATEYEEALER